MSARSWISMVWVAFFVCALPGVEAEAGLFKKAKKRYEKGRKKVKKATRGSISKARKELRKAGKSVSRSTGKIAGVVKKGYDLSSRELQSAAKYAAKKFREAGKALGKLANAAVKRAYQKIYKKYVKDYAQLASQILQRESRLRGAVARIGRNLSAGNFHNADRAARSFLKSRDLRPILSAARKIGAGSLVLVADFAAGSNNVGVSGAVGIAISLQGKSSVKAAIFNLVGGTVTTSSSANAGIGISLGFLRGKPSDIAGSAVDIQGSVSVGKNKAATVSLSFPPPRRRRPYVSAKPSLFLVGFGLGVGNGGASLSIGGSYTSILQKIK